MAEVDDTPFVTGPDFEQLQANDVWVTPTGGTRKTLADALADTGGGSVTKITVVDGPFLQGTTITTSGTILSSVNPTAHGVLIGQGASAIAATVAMTNGQLLVGQSGADPAPRTISGDATVNNSGVLALSATGVVAGTYGDASHSVTVDVDDAGRILSISENVISGGVPAVCDYIGSDGVNFTTGNFSNGLSDTVFGPGFVAIGQADHTVVDATYTLLNTDHAKVVWFTAACAVTLPQAGQSSQFLQGWTTFIANTSSGDVVVTPTVSTIDDGGGPVSSLTLGPTQTAWIWTGDGVDYRALVGGISGGAVGTVTSVATGSGLSGGPITTSGTINADWNGGTVTALGTGVSLVGGTLSAVGSGGSVTEVDTGTGLTGGPISTTGTVSLATRTASTLMGNPGTAAATPSDIAIGTGLTLSTGGTLSASGSGGTVTNIATSGLVTGGPITTTGTISLDAQAATTLIGNGTTASAVPTAIPIGSGLAFSSGTLTATGSGGSVTSVATGTGLTGGPITTSGTVSLATIADARIFANVSGSSAAPSATPYAGIHVTSGTLVADWNAGTITSVGTGLSVSSGTISATGTGIASISGTFSANGSLGAVPASAMIVGATLQETAGHAVAVSLGTASGGAQILSATTVGASGIVPVPSISLLLQAWTSSQSVFVASSNWNSGTVVAKVWYLQ